MCGVTAWSTDSSTLSGGLMVCVYLCECISLWFFVFMRFLFSSLVFALLVWWLCVCLYHRCCPGRRVVFSHTPSSIKTTQAARMNWTSSSMEENSSSLFCWTLWVKRVHTAQLLSCTLGNPFNWWCKLRFKQGTGLWQVRDSSSDGCIVFALFTLLWKLPLLEPKCSVENPSYSSTCFVLRWLIKVTFITIFEANVTLRSLQIIVFLSMPDFLKPNDVQTINKHPFFKQFRHSLAFPISISPQLFQIQI